MTVNIIMISCLVYNTVQLLHLDQLQVLQLLHWGLLVEANMQRVKNENSYLPLKWTGM